MLITKKNYEFFAYYLFGSKSLLSKEFIEILGGF